MQPYFFPYLGYWQLIGAVDRFVVYDDVNYIKGGWINRNRILINDKATYLTAPLHHPSPNKRICDLNLQASSCWRDKLVKTVELTYRKSPYFTESFQVIEDLIRHDECDLSSFLAHQLRVLSKFVGFETEFVDTSRCYGNDHLSGHERLLDICGREGAVTYINPQGGRGLYDANQFSASGVELKFLVMRPTPYEQRTKGFVPYLSIIDALMELGSNGLRRYLHDYDLVS